MKKKTAIKKKSNNGSQSNVTSNIISFDTFREFGSYDITGMKNNEPSCFNSRVRVKKFKVTIEQIEEPNEVYAERLNKLWRECDNHHHYHPLLGTAKEMGIELNKDDFGKEQKK